MTAGRAGFGKTCYERAGVPRVRHRARTRLSALPDRRRGPLPRRRPDLAHTGGAAATAPAREPGRTQPRQALRRAVAARPLRRASTHATREEAEKAEAALARALRK